MKIKWQQLRPRNLVSKSVEIVTKAKNDLKTIKAAVEEKNKALDEIYEMQYGKKPKKGK